MGKTVIKLNEQQIRQIVAESCKRVLKENGMSEEDMEEGWLGNKWNQAKAAGSTMLGKGNGGLKNRFQQSTKNWNTQGKLNDLNGLRTQLEKYIDAGQISPETTVAQLVGGKYRNGQFGKLTAQQGNLKGQITKNGGKWQSEEE